MFMGTPFALSGVPLDIRKGDCMSRGELRTMVAFEFGKPIPYREKMVRSFYEKMLLLSAECKTKAQFEKESMDMVNGLFDKIELEAREYYAICKIRAELLDTLRWVDD